MNLLSAKKAAKLFNVHPNTIRDWYKKGVINAVMVGKSRKRYDVDSVEHKPTEGLDG